MLFTNSKCWPSGGSTNRKQNVGWRLELLGLPSMFDPRCPSKSLSNQLLQDQYFNSTDRHHKLFWSHQPNKLINKWWLMVFCLFNRPIKITVNFCLFVSSDSTWNPLNCHIICFYFTELLNWCGGFYCERTGCRRWESLPVCCSWGWWCWTLKVVFLFFFPLWITLNTINIYILQHCSKFINK